MKKVLLLFAAMTILIPMRSALSQTLSDYVKEVKGDTLVIKDYYDMGNKSNSLADALLGDTINVPADRVYELKANGYYPIRFNPTSSAKHPTVIVGPDTTMVVINKNASLSPPLICGDEADGGEIWGSGIDAGGDLTIKNCELTPGANDGRLSISFTAAYASNLHLLYDNCIFEHTRWVFVGIEYASCNVTFRNCYFVNMSGQPCRRNGGVYDGFANDDTMLVENCTHVMAQGSVYKLRSNLWERVIINHNTFINMAGSTFMSLGYQSNMSVTNNIFVNCNVQPYPSLHSIDQGEQDPDWLPMGLVNVYPDSADVASNTPRKFLCQGNDAYWDPSLANADSIENANKVNGVTDWQSQMIIMNSRTDSVFKHTGRFNRLAYWYCLSDIWRNEMPHFTDPKNLFTTQLANLKTFAVSTVDTNSGAVLPDWRLVSTGDSNYVHPDWPIPVDLSYSDADLKATGLGGFPLGDLNWFPAQKAAWLQQSASEYAYIQQTLDDGFTHIPGAVQEHVNLPATFALQQNYPNPSNPTTVISYQLPVNTLVTLKVYDELGRLVKTLVNDRQTAGAHSVTFNASNLSSGVYFYRLSAGNFVETKKLMLIK